MASILWAYLIVGGTLIWLAHIIMVMLTDRSLSAFAILPATGGPILAVTYLVQSAVSVMIDARFEAGIRRSLFWVVWFPLAFWFIQGATAVIGLPRAIFRKRGARGVWTSPDRGFR